MRRAVLARVAAPLRRRRSLQRVCSPRAAAARIRRFKKINATKMALSNAPSSSSSAARAAAAAVAVVLWALLCLCSPADAALAATIAQVALL